MGAIKQLMIEEDEARERRTFGRIDDRRTRRVFDHEDGAIGSRRGDTTLEDDMTDWKKQSMAEQLDALLAGEQIDTQVTSVTTDAAEQLDSGLSPTFSTTEGVANYAAVSMLAAVGAPESVSVASESAQEAPATASVPVVAASEPLLSIDEASEQQQAIDEGAPVVVTTASVTSVTESAVSEESVDNLLTKPKKRRETKDERKARLEREKPLVGAISTEKMVHGEMILNGVCTNCVRCGMKLTDAVSIERGMGPECSSKGYAEDPQDSDEIGAMIELSKWPELVDFLTVYYKPQGVRGLMNGLVRIAALNRKTEVHGACAAAIELLGYRQLAAALRDSLAVVSIKESAKYPDFYEVWVKRTEFSWDWFNVLKRIPGFRFEKRGRFGKSVNLVPKTEKRRLWWTLIKHYEGLVAKTPSGAIRIALPTHAS